MSFSKEHALDFLKKAMSENRLGHAYLLTGSTTTEVGILTEELAALVLGCTLLHLETHPDFYLIEPESRARKILTEQMRVLEHALALSPQVSTHKVVIIHDADRMVPAAANAFLKTLEEPPDKTLLLLTTTLPEALLQTIRSRCIILPLHQSEKAPQEMYEKNMEELAISFFQPGAPVDATAAFQFTRAFQGLLAAAREEAVEAANQEFRDEKNHYGKTTDAPWEGRREEHFKAAAEASALSHRSLLLGTLATYFGNRLRALYETTKEHNDQDVVRLLRSLEVVESMRNTLERGVQEALALEAGFLELMEVYKIRI